MNDDPRHFDFYLQQHERVKFYAQDFWESTKFFSGLLTVLLSLPVAGWMAEDQPLGWTAVAAAAPALALAVSIVSIVVLKRTAGGYYQAAASLLVLERELGLQQMRRGEFTLNLVTMDRFELSALTVDGLSQQLISRLKILGGWSRMGVILKLFWMYAFLAAAELSVLLLHAFFGINLVRLLVSS